MKSQGFTIVEVVIVIAVAAILSTLGIVAGTQVQKDSRDKKRDTDIVLLQNELEKFYEKNGEYPPGCTEFCTSWFFTENVSTGGAIFTSTTTNATLKTHLPGLTTYFYDPKNTTPDTPLADIASPSTRYYYFGGTVNKRTTSSSAPNSTPAPKACKLRQHLDPGQVGSYTVGYYSEIENRWILRQGTKGRKAVLETTSDPSCKID